jgi:hypothetical protein
VVTVKPPCKLIGKNGNIFNLLGLASRTLKDAGLDAEVEQMRERVLGSSSYDEALTIIGQYVHVE